MGPTRFPLVKSMRIGNVMLDNAKHPASIEKTILKNSKVNSIVVFLMVIIVILIAK